MRRADASVLHSNLSSTPPSPSDGKPRRLHGRLFPSSPRFDPPSLRIPYCWRDKSRSSRDLPAQSQNFCPDLQNVAKVADDSLLLRPIETAHLAHLNQQVPLGFRSTHTS